MVPDNAETDGGCARQPEDVDPKDVLKTIEKHGADRASLLSILSDIQATYRHLPADALRMVADQIGYPLVDVYGAATFYKSFSLTPKGKHLICACLGTACHVRGAPRVVDEFQRQLGIGPGETTPDQEFTLETVNCLGACALGPVVVIDGHYFSKVRKSRVRQLIEDALAGLDKADSSEDKRVFPVEVSCPRCEHGLMDESVPIDGHPSVRVRVALDGKESWLRLSSLYGSYSILAEHDVPLDTVVSFLCPHCKEELVGSCACPFCRAPMVTMAVRGGGTAQVCSRRGCRYHMLDLG